tara:strand:- start:640 stop:6105 length:5466 start_codon:yes stop_codon:yes gene_type:complete
MPQVPQTLNIVNNSGYLKFESTAALKANTTDINLNSTGQFKIESDANSLMKITNGNANVEVNSGHLNLINSKPSSNSSILIESNGTGGGIKLNSNHGGITQLSTGNIDINSKNENINLGVFTQDPTANTKKIVMESSEEITMNTEDYQLIASDTISLISLTGDIRIGSSLSSSIIKFENDNLLVNQITSDYDRQLDINVSDEASSSPGYNGILVNSSNNSVAADIKIQTNDSNSSVSLGMSPYNSKYSYYKKYVGYQTGTTLVKISGDDFTRADIGRNIYLSTTDATDTILSLGTIITSANNNYGTINMTTSGTYTGSTNKIYRVEVDKTGTPDTIKWSNDAGKTYNYTQISITGSAITLEEGVQITFAATTGNSLGDYWTFSALVTATVGTSRSIANSEVFYTLQPYTAYLETSNTSDIVFKTVNNEQARITADGNFGYGKKNPGSTFEITNNIDKTMLVNEYHTEYQLNPFSAPLENGGYVVVWESKGQDTDDYGIYLQQFMCNGNKYGSQIKVNNTVAGNQSFPHVTGRRTTNSQDFIVVWASEESDGSGVYDIYGKLYINGTALSGTDIHITSGSSTNQQLYVRVCGLENGNYCVVWASEESASSAVYNINGRIIDNNGNLGSVFVVNYNTSLSQNYPYPIGICNNDANIPGGLVVTFMNDYDTDNSGEADFRYNIKFARFSISGTTASRYPTSTTADTIVTSSSYPSISDGLVSGYHLYDGGFVLSFYRNYEAKTSFYNNGEYVTGETSGTSGIISNISSNVLTITGIGSDKYLVGELLTINSQREEKVAAVTHSGGGSATITLSKGHKSVVMYKYGTNGSASLSNIQVNTSKMEEDTERANIALTNYVRNNTIFTFKNPLPQIVEMYNKRLAVVWSNGKIPSIYYQIINETTGALVGSEEQISVLYSELKQRNPTVSPLKTLENVEAGLAIVWDNETLDLSNTGIYQTIVNPNNHILHINNNNSDFVINNSGKLGLGTTNPSEQLHSVSSNNNNVAIEVSKTNLDTSKFTNINFIGKDSVILGQISSNNTRNYQKLTPKYDNLLAYYKFDEENGSNFAYDSTKNNLVGRLENFDIENSWKNGLINNGLEFDGINDYINVGQENLLYNLPRGSGSGNDYTISCWVKMANNIFSGSNLDIISNNENGNLNTVGTYIFGIRDYGSNGTAFVSSSLTSSTGYFKSDGNTDISDNNWHLVNSVYHNSNTTIQNYVDGVLDSNVTLTGTINGAPTSNVFIGSRDSSTGFFKGMLDELRVFNTALSYSEIQNLYDYGSKDKGEISFTTQNGLTNNILSNDSHGFVLDDTGKITGTQLKGRPFKKLSGTFTTNSSNGLVTGNGTSFDNELQIGDTISYSSYNKVITSLSDNTNLTVDSASNDANNNHVIRKPAITSFFDQEDNLMGVMDHNGNLIIGGSVPSSKLEIQGSGDSNDLPHLTLFNNTDEDIDNGRETKIIFNGNNNGTTINNGFIEVSHDGSSNDNKGKMRFYTNNGSSVNEVMRFSSTGNVGIGINSEPLGNLQIKNITNETNNVVLTSSESFNKIFGESNNIYFQGLNSSLPNTDLDRYSLSSIKGSCNDNTSNPVGRLDLLTNNDNALGLQKRVSILNDGNVGIGITQPVGRFHAAAKSNINNNFVGSQSGTTVTLSTGVILDDNIIGGYVIFDDSSHTRRKITARTNSTTLEVDTSGTVGSNNISIYYSGLIMDNTGNVAVGTDTTLSKFHIEGPLSTAIKTVTSDYGTTNNDSTIIGNPAGSSTITITLTNIASIVGRRYIIKNISASGTVTISPGSGTIDGAANKSLTSQYKFVELQTDGSNWHIIGAN